MGTASSPYFSNLKRDYGEHEDFRDLGFEEPQELFEAWFERASEISELEANAFCLMTVDGEGQADGRILLMKKLERYAHVFFTNLESKKALDFTSEERVACLFYWPTLQRQVRIKGRVERVSRQLDESYFASRPRDSQLSAWCSPQSREISPSLLQEELKQIHSRFEGMEAIPCPPFWGGYRVVWQEVEFWQGQRSRFHQRLLFERLADAKGGVTWNQRTLGP